MKPIKNRRLGKGMARFLGILLIIILVWAAIPPFTLPISGDNSIAEIQTLTLGRFPQKVLLRGINRNNPILLYMHGGPGAAQMVLAPTYSNELEKHFVVAHWDQRGASVRSRTSCPAATKPPSPTS